MNAYHDMNQADLKPLHQELLKQYQAVKAFHLPLNTARGTPAF